MKFKQPYDIEEHRSLGKELFQTRNQMIHLLVNLSRRYGSRKRLVKLTQRTVTALDLLRCELDDQLARDYPNEFDSTIYYPGASDRRLKGST